MFKQSLIKILSMLCVITLVLGCIMQPALASADYTDISDSDFEQAIEMLTAMGIVEGNGDGTFGTEREVTRAEIITMILRATEYESFVGGEGVSPFTDTKGHWAENYITFAYKLGLVSGNGDGTFSPDAPVKFEEAVKMAVNMIDYGVLAEQKGGFPGGYISIAAENKMLDDINSFMGQNMTRGQVAGLLYNAMNTPMLIQDNWGDNVSYKKGGENDTLIAKFTLDTEGYGIVSKVSYASLEGTLGTEKAGMVEIAVDEKRYVMNVGNTNAEALLGRQVDFLALKDCKNKDRYTLIYIKETESSEILKIDADDIIEADYEKKIITYINSETDKEKKIKLDLYAPVLYNNQKVEDPAKQKWVPDNGYIVVVENNDGVGYDAVFSYDFDNVVVSSSNIKDGVKNIYFKSSNNVPVSKIEFDLEDGDKTIICYVDGEYVSNEDMFDKEIPAWSVASVANSKNGRVTEVYFSTKVVSGSLESVREDDGIEYNIGGNWYKAADEFDDELEIGKDYSLSVSFDGKIVAINTDVTNVTNDYALLLKSKFKDNGLEDDVASFKMILANGETVVKDGAKKISLNNKSRAELTQTDLDSIPENSLILFSENSDGEIISIETADDSNVCLTTNGYIDYGDKNVFTLNASTNLYYKNSNPATLGGDVKVNDKTLVFDVSSADEEEWGTGSISLFNNETVYMVDIYDIDNFKMAKVVVNHGPAVEQKNLIPWGNAPVVIREVVSKLDENGKAVRVLTGMQNGKDFEMKLKDNKVCDEEKENYLVDLRPGSVVQVKTNMLHEIVSIRKLYKAPSKTEVFETLGSKNWEGADYNVKLHTGYGMCVDANEEVMTVAYRMDDKITAYSITGANIYLFDTKKQTLKSGDITDIKPASSYGYDDCTRVFIRMEKDNVKDIVIFD